MSLRSPSNHSRHQNFRGLTNPKLMKSIKLDSLSPGIRLSYVSYHTEVMAWRRFPHYCPFVRAIQWWTVNSPHKSPVMWKTLIFSLLLLPTSCWINSVRFPCWMPLVFFGFTNCVLFYDKKTNTRMFVTIGIRFKQHYDIRYFAFFSLWPPRMFLSLDLLSEYRIQHGTIGPLYVTFRYPTRIFCQSQYSKTWDRKCLALIAQLVRAFGMNPKVGGSSPSQIETFSVSKLWHFLKNTRSCVENEWCCLRTVNISNVSFTLKYPFGYSTGEFQALQLIVLAAFGVVDQPLASCMSVHFLEIDF